MVERGANPDLADGPKPPAAERSIHHRADDDQAKGAHHDRHNDHEPDDYHDPDNHHQTVVAPIQLSGGCQAGLGAHPLPSCRPPSYQDAEEFSARLPRLRQRALGIGARVRNGQASTSRRPWAADLWRWKVLRYSLVSWS